MVVVCIFAILLVFALTSQNAKLTPDSVQYFKAATLFSLEKQLGEGYVHWPPLYPVVLSFYSHTQESINNFATDLNRILFILSVISLWMIARKSISSPSVLCLLLIVTTLSGTLQFTYSYVWSETLYIPLTVFTTYFWIAFLNRENGKLNFLLSCLLLSLCVLTRHVGVALFVAMFGTLLLSRNFNPSEKIKHSLFLMAATTPYLLWLLRTWSISGHLTGQRGASQHSDLLFQLEKFGNVISHWVIPHIYFQSMGLLVTTVLGILFAVLLITLIKIGTNSSETPKYFTSYRLQLIIFLLAYSLLYSVLVIISACNFPIDPLGDRLLGPIYWSVFIILMALFEVAWNYFDRNNKFHSKRTIEYFGVLYFIMWISGPNALNDLIF